MGLLCSKFSLNSVATTKESTSPIEIHGASEKTAHVGKFIRRKMAKKRPVISTPRPANPVFLHGRKWKHVIVTIPTLDDPPPIPPVRKKRNQRRLQALESRPSRYTGDPALVEIMTAIQLRRCLRVLNTGTRIDWQSQQRIEGKKRALGDLFFTTLRENETAITVFAVPLNIDYSENRSLTNEQNDSFFDNANVRGYGFKNFIFFAARPLKSDHDKLKFRKTCRPAAYRSINANLVEIRAPATVDAKNEKLYVFVLRANIDPAQSSITPSAAESQSHSINVKNISNKTNQKPNTYRSSNANIEKVCDEMKNILRQDTPAIRQKTIERDQRTDAVTFGPIYKNQSHTRKNDPVQMHHSDGIFISRPINRQRSLENANTTFSKLHCKYMKNNADSDRDSDCSITDSLNEFSYSL